jgi:hypothetical protein
VLGLVRSRRAINRNRIVKQVLSVAKKRLPVEIQFSSKKPSAAAGTLSFVDTQGREYSIQVAAVTDNSHWGVYPFYAAHADNLAFGGGPGKPLTVRLQDSHAKPDWIQLLKDSGYNVPADSNLVAAGGFAALQPLVAESILMTKPRDLELIVLWANAGLFPKAVQSFEALIDTQGKILFEMMDALDKGKKQGNDKKSKRETLALLPDRPKGSETKELLAQYQELLDLIKVNGGLVSNVVATHLLPFRALSTIYFQDAQSKGPFSLKGFYTEHYEVLQRAAWAAVLFQLIRILALNRVTPKFYESCVASAMAAPTSPLRGHVTGSVGGRESVVDGAASDRGLSSARSARSGRSGAVSPRGSQAGGSQAGDLASDGGGGGRKASTHGHGGERGHVSSGSNAFSTPEVVLLKWSCAAS